MKSIVIYYSWTGNTKQIAEAIYSGMKELSEECDIARLQLPGLLSSIIRWI
jgi:flavodoxin